MPMVARMNDRIASPGIDAQLRALSTAERRRVLHALAETDPDDAVDVGRFADAAATDPLLSLYHVHLPKLEGMGLVDVDRERRSVRRGQNFDDIEPLVRLIDERADRLAGNRP